MIIFCRAALFILVTLWSGMAAAQTLTLDPDDAIETTTETTPQSDNETTQEAATAAQAALTEAPQTRAAPVRAAPRRRVVRRAAPASFVLRDLRIEGRSAYLDAQDIAAFEQNLEGRRYLNSSVTEIAGAVRQLYAGTGISTAYARVSAFNPRSGVLILQLVEPRLGAVRVNEGIISERYFAYRLNLGEGSPADDRLINARLARLQLTDGLPLTVGFVQTGRVDLVDLGIALPELEKHRSFVTLDNYGSAAQGREQLTFGHTINSITGWNDPLSVFITLREGSQAGTLTYQRVVTPNGGTLGFVLSHSNTKSLSATPVKGRLSTGAVSFSAPLLVEADRRLTFVAGLRQFRETSDLAGERILDQRGGDIALGLNGFRRGENWTLSGGAQFILGRYSAGGAAQQRYDILSANITYSRTLGRDVFGSITVAGQKVTRGTAPASRQFTVTSPSGVRGYPTSLTSDDTGYFARFQIEKSTPYAFREGKLGLRPFAFFDLGETFDTAGNGLGLAKSVGIGASFFRRDNVIGDIYIAKPLNKNVSGFVGRSASPRLNVSLTIQF